jgi:putative hydrolase of the HAD superfamily
MTLPDLSGVRGLALDAVGTLITPCPSVSVAYAAAAARQGVRVDVATMKDRFARSFARDEIDEARGPMSTSETVERRRWRRIVAECLPEVPDPDRAFGELWAHFARPEHWELYPDAARLIDDLPALGLRCVIASNFDARLRDVLAGIPALARFSTDAVISSEVGHRKPHPAFYAAACRRLDLPPPAVLHVGDDPIHDGIGPRDAGLSAVVIVRDRAEPLSLDDLAARFRAAGRR